MAPIAPSQTLVSDNEERPGVENDEIAPPVFERMATPEEIARIREELDARDAGSTKHAHWCRGIDTELRLPGLAPQN